VRQQRDAIEAIVRLTAGASIAEEIVDLNVSGGSMERERVQDAIDRLLRGEADGIVVAYLDRASGLLIRKLDTSFWANSSARVRLAGSQRPWGDGLFDRVTGGGMEPVIKRPPALLDVHPQQGT
jgi:hypothetical protein